MRGVPGPGTNKMMTADIGLPSSLAVVAYAEGRYHDVIAELEPIRLVLNRFGGSHAQRDALQRTLLESALRAGELELARTLVAERISLRESSVYGWSRRARLLRAMDDVARADAADATAGITSRASPRPSVRSGTSDGTWRSRPTSVRRMRRGRT